MDEINFSGLDYLKKFNSKFRHDIKYREKKLSKIGNIKFEIVADIDLLDKYIDEYYDVYSKSWQKRERIGPTFHRDLAKMAAKKKRLRLGFLRINNTPIASQFWIVCARTAYILKTVYNQEFKNYSPGKILTLRMFQNVIDEDRVLEIDYLHGDEQYKKDWVTKRRIRKKVIIFNKNIKGQYLKLTTKKVLPKFIIKLLNKD
jgi:CelD/BcsL family acetyltransferase involved in cellulose biosynthesis